MNGGYFFNSSNKGERKILNLSELTDSLEINIRKNYPDSFRCRCEISKLNFYKYSGHAYPELVEKRDGRIVSQIRSIIWQRDFQRINAKFIQVLKEPLRDGISIVCRARLSYSSVYGLSLIIEDIDPLVALGDLEREKNECISRLKAENLWNMNKERKLAFLPQRIAVISVGTSKGYSDFIQTIEQKSKGFTFYIHLFPSLLQGDGASIQLREALSTIEIVKDYFDCVLIIRGGGGDIGLSCYNDYKLCHKIATFPLPVITGIGHSTNETVSEMVSYANFITPTAVADFLIEKFEGFLFELDSIKERIIKNTKNILANKEKELNYSKKILSMGVKNLMEKEKISLAHQEKLIMMLNPLNILKKGYSISTKNGKIIKSMDGINLGDEIETNVYGGKFKSEITEIKQ
ncbi:MAG: exodeoxyribonuclease VII large subunit [Bacteroidales bacterium]|nr:exodeoxyribonuclease VII large subunit [Bacteroidales bacterium]